MPLPPKLSSTQFLMPFLVSIKPGKITSPTKPIPVLGGESIDAMSLFLALEPIFLKLMSAEQFMAV
jgi:hypothetical protein